MKWTPAPLDPELFHITHLENLAGILRDGGLWSDAKRRERGFASRNIGYEHIKQRRMRRPVPVGSGGVVGEYVPFYFCPRSVMLYVIHRGHQNYGGGQNAVVHLVSRLSRVAASGPPWVFTDRHAELAYAEFRDRWEPGQVDWSLMPLDQWGGDSDRKERRQAEFLVREWFPWSAVEAIATCDVEVAKAVRGIVEAAAHRPPVHVRGDWYYG